MYRKSILFFIIIIILTVVGVVYWQADKNGVSVLDIIKTTKEDGRKMNWDNSEEVFNVKAPDDFDVNRLERLEEKITAAKNLYTDKKDKTWTWIVIGNMYEFAHDYDRAIGAYEKGASLNKAEYISRMNLAYIYENQKKDYVKAEEYYKKVIELNGTNPDQYVNLARLYEFKINLLEEAEKIYQAGLAKTSNNPDLLVAVIRFYQRINKFDKATEYASQLLKSFPDDEAYKSDFGSLVEKK